MMNRVLACALVVPLVVPFAAACSDGGDSEPVTLTTTVKRPASEAAESPAEETTTEAAATVAQGGFDDVLANPAKWAAKSQDEYFKPSGSYDYAMADLDGDGTDELLLRTNGVDFAPIKVLRLVSGVVTPVEGYVIEGAASAGGSRARVYASNSGRGIYEISGMSANQDAWYHMLYSIGSGKLEEVERQKTVYDPRLPDYQQLSWRPAGAGAQTAVAAPATDPRFKTLSGTFRTITAREYVQELTNYGKTANGESLDERFLMFFFDEPQTMTGMRGPSMDTETVEFAVVEGPYNDPTGWGEYEGQHVTITYDPTKLYYPSDTSMPLGALRMTTAITSVQP